MKEKDLRKRIDRIREAQTIITNEINSIYNDVSDVLEKEGLHNTAQRRKE